MESMGFSFNNLHQNLKSNAPKLKANDNLVFDNIIAAAQENNNRLVSIMYDLSGSNATSTMVEDVKLHWESLVSRHGVNDIQTIIY